MQLTSTALAQQPQSNHDDVRKCEIIMKNGGFTACSGSDVGADCTTTNKRGNIVFGTCEVTKKGWPDGLICSCI
jgi:hypothetical protein